MKWADYVALTSPLVEVLAAKLLYTACMTGTPGVDRIERVETFVRIVEAGSLSSAARQLGMTQPTVSRRLQGLENWLGLKLVQRTTHMMRLTKDGERFFARAKELLAAWRAMEEDLRGAKDAPFGALRVVVPHAFGQAQLVAPLLEFLRTYPDVSVEWILHDRHPNFIAEGIDCAIHVGTMEDPAMVALHLADVPRIAVAAPALCEGYPKLTVEELPSLPWLALSSFYRHEVVLKQSKGAETRRFPIHPRFSTDNIYSLRIATLAGFGASLVSTWAVADDIAAGRLLHLTPEWCTFSLPVFLVYPYARFYPAKLRRFTELMRERIPKLLGVSAPVRHKSRDDRSS